MAAEKKRLVPISIREEEIRCDRTHEDYDTCLIDGPTVLDPIKCTFFLMDPTRSTPQNPVVEKIRSYPRKAEDRTMSKITEVTIVAGPPSPRCQFQHNAPAVVFSVGGYGSYAGNFFHDFNDGFIPMFVTVNSFFPDQDVVLVLTDVNDWWASKYTELLRTFSKHPIINLDNESATHCFPSASLGMITHGPMTVNPTLLPNAKDMTDFRAFLGKAYGQTQNQNPPKSRPRLVITSRRGTVGRQLLNENEVKIEAEKMGFDVSMLEPKRGTPLNESYALINSSHAMVGVHGAALTHSLFLRPGAVFVQVVPLGTEWVSEICFEMSAKAMGLEYMEYKIMAEESSLIETYSKDEMIIRDPVAYRGEKFSNHPAMRIYLRKQNVKLDLVRFREYLKLVYVRAKKFMDKEG
jgi:protein O-GlcNAc transferase